MSDDQGTDRPIRQAAGAVVDAGLASNGVGTIVLAVGGALVGFAVMR